MKKIVRSEFAANVLRLMTGTTLSQVITFMAMPLLSRLFSPEEFGIYAFYTSLITLLVVFSTGRYELAIPLPKEKSDALQILLLSFLILTGFSTFVFLLVLLFNQPLVDFLGRPALQNWLYLLPVFVFFTGAYNIFTLWFHRLKQFGAAANSKVHLSLWENILNLLFGFKKNGFDFSSVLSQIKSLFIQKNVILSLNNIGFNGLLFGRLSGLIVSNFYFILKLNRSDFNEKFNKHKAIELAKKHSDFPKINMFHAASDELKNSGLSFTILYFFMESVLGLYNQTYRLLRAPLGIIGSAFGHVFFQEAAELSYNKKAIRPLISSTMTKLFWIALPLFTAVFFLSPWFFKMFLGEKWSEVGIYAQYMTPWLFVNFILSPISHVAIVVGKQFQFWMVNLVSSSLVFLSMIVAGWGFNDIKIGLVIISVTQVIYSAYMYHWILKIAAWHDRKI